MEGGTSSIFKLYKIAGFMPRFFRTEISQSNF